VQGIFLTLHFNLLYTKILDMRQLFFAAILVMTSLLSVAQPAGALKKLKKGITLKVARSESDEMPGTRGASVAWHPGLKKYYAAMAGNVAYPLSVFDATGKRVSPDSLNCEADVRGLWYNPVAKTIQGNAYGDGGWFSYKLDAKGMVKEVESLMEEMTQPNEQSVGAYNPVASQVLFLDGSKVFFYKMSDGLSEDFVNIHWGRTKAEGASEEEDETVTPVSYNTSLVFTGIKGAELGFLNIDENQIELYSIEDGFLTRKLQLPEGTASYQSFNFAFSNGMYWLFNIEARTWTSYK